MLRVLTYHRVLPRQPTEGSTPMLVSATTDTLARHMRHVTLNYDAVSMADVLARVDGGPSLPPRAVLVTFDDAYRDFAEHAWPVLERYRVPVTLFVPTAFPDRPSEGFWWDRLFLSVTRTKRTRLAASPFGPLSLASEDQRRLAFGRIREHLKSLPHAEAMRLVAATVDELGSVDDAPPPVLSWEELRRLARRGVGLGAHSRRHPLLTAVAPEEAQCEIEGSRRDLEREIGQVPPVFCYPAGAVDETVRRLVLDAGFRLAFTTEDGHNQVGSTDRLLLRRTGITLRTTPAVFRLRLYRMASYVDRWRHRKRARGA